MKGVAWVEDLGIVDVAGAPILRGLQVALRACSLETSLSRKSVGDPGMGSCTASPHPCPGSLFLLSGRVLSRPTFAQDTRLAGWGQPDACGS